MTYRNRKARLLVIGGIGLGLGLLLLINACGVGTNGIANTTNTSAPTPTSSTTVLRPADLQSALLTLSEVPSAWSVDTTSSGTSSAAGSVSEPTCLKNLDAENRAGEISGADVKFHGSSSGIPFFEEQLSSFEPGSVEGKLSAFDRMLAACGPITFTAVGYTFTGTIEAMSFPTVGDESRAYQLNLSTRASGKNVAIGIDFVVARKGDTALVLLIGDLGAPDLRQFQRLAGKALSKVASAAYV
jgi:hypothetical protein